MTFNIIRNAGTPQTAITPAGQAVHREDKLFIPEWGIFIECAGYDDHFIYENPDKREGTPAYLCTCGSVAVVAPPGPGGLFVCLFDLNTGLLGKHSTTLYNLREWDRVKGQKLDMGKIRKELI